MTPCAWGFNVSMQLVVWLLWTAGLVLVGLTALGVLEHPFAPMGVCFVAFGCTGQIGLWMRQIAAEERNAFELGRDSVTSLRR